MTSAEADALRAASLEPPPVSAVIVTFNPDVANLGVILEALSPQVERVAIVDNGSSALTVDALERLARRHGCFFIGLARNLGIAAAQNRGASELIAQLPSGAASAQFLLFLDHDSVPMPDMVEQLLATDMRMRAQGERVGAVGPLTLDKRTRTDGRFMQSGRFWIRRAACGASCPDMKVDFLISSGTLVRIDVWKDVGGMNEGLFIDHVDTEWCLRVLTRGYALFGACRARLLHSLGDEVVRVWLMRRREVFIHSPLRDYYMCRNTLALLRNLPMSFAWRAFLLVRLIGSMVFFGVVAPPRGARWRLMWAGIVDGLTGKGGSRMP